MTATGRFNVSRAALQHGSVGDGYTHSIKPFLWEKKDEKKYNTEWKPEICGGDYKNAPEKLRH
jgi:hypothetical protein